MEVVEDLVVAAEVQGVVEVVEAQEEDLEAATIASKVGILRGIASSPVATATRKVILPLNAQICQNLTNKILQ